MTEPEASPDKPKKKKKSNKVCSKLFKILPSCVSRVKTRLLSHFVLVICTDLRLSLFSSLLFPILSLSLYETLNPNPKPNTRFSQVAPVDGTEGEGGAPPEPSTPKKKKGKASQLKKVQPGDSSYSPLTGTAGFNVGDR